MPVDANSRIQVLDFAPSLPGTCALCGSAGGDKRKFVDFGFQLDYFGAVYFCTFCMDSIAEALDYISQLETDILNTSLKNAQTESLRLIEENQALRYAMVAILSSDTAGISDPNKFLVSLLASVEKQLETNGTESKPNEARSKQGPKRVSNTRKESDF